jgi:hypothetical protein
MRRFPALVLTLFSLVISAALAAAVYKHAWRIPVVQDLRGAQLFCALWIMATPVLMVAAAAARLARWSSAFKSTAVFLVIAAPGYLFTSGFNKVRDNSRDKAVLCNLRQLSAAADQYFLENNVTVVKNYEDLVGATQYIKQINVINGEDYRGNFPLKHEGVLSAEFPSGRIICYYPGPMLPGDKLEYEPGEIPRWKQAQPKRPAGSTVQTPTSSHAPKAIAATNAALARELGQPTHTVRRGTMCASCHAKKN